MELPWKRGGGAMREAQMRETVARFDVALQTYRLRYVTGQPVIPNLEELP